MYLLTENYWPNSTSGAHLLLVTVCMENLQTSSDQDILQEERKEKRGKSEVTANLSTFSHFNLRIERGFINIREASLFLMEVKFKLGLVDINVEMNLVT